MISINPSKIKEIRYWKIGMPFKAALEWGSGKRPQATRLVVEITLESGTKGYGETICLLEFIEPVLVKTVIPVALKYNVENIEAFTKNIFGAGYYHHKRAVVMAMAAIEMAMWDAKGKLLQVPVYKLLGGMYRKSVEVSAYLFGTDQARLKQSAQEFLDKGYKSFKVKIGMEEYSDIKNVETLRSTVGNKHLRADVNSAWTPGTAKRMLNKLMPFDLQYIEQPLELDDIAGHSDLRRQQMIPVALDESAYTLADVGNIVRAGAADVILLDPHEIGGMWQTVKAAAIAEAVGIPVTLHSGGELAVSQSAYVHLASSIPNMSISIDSERDYLVDDIAKNPPVVVDGCLSASDNIGLGVDIDFEKIEKYTVDHIKGAYLDASRPTWFTEKPAY